MAVKVDLPKPLLKAALDQAAGLRSRNAKAATNDLIKGALEDEERAIRDAAKSMTEIK